MGIYAIKPAFQRRLERVRDLCVRRRIPADALTLAGLASSVAGGMAFVASGRAPWLLLLVPALAIGRTALNALDGMVALASGTARPFGEVLNEFADRLSDAAWFAGLAFVVDPRLALAALVLVLLSSYLGTATKAAGGPRVYAGVMGKADRMIAVSVAGPAAFLLGRGTLTVLVWAVAAGACVTIAQRLRAAARSLPPG